MVNPEFKKVLDKSQEAVEWFSEILEQQGIKTEVNPLQYEKSDSGDLFYYEDGERKVGEVKQLSLLFTNRENYKYNAVLVNSLTGILTKGFVPDKHFLVSGDRKAYLVVDKETFPLWRVENKFDTVKGRYIDFYFLNKKHAEFYTI